MRRWRDLVRSREDAVAVQRQARQRLAALLLRNDVRYAGKTAWTAAHRRWIADLRLPQPAQRLAFEEYVQTVEEASARVQRLTQCIEQELATWRWRPVVDALQACRGIQLIHAARIVAELVVPTQSGGPMWRARKPRVSCATSSDCSSSAKWPASRIRISASGTSRA